ncbi:hypothetical protein EUGRSUZ_F00787 [Eucalyptus grandis]|uniref:Uncharacterized protein n=2 Tax=Eucalyptus grandis TaxID=71139 RepID=A0ACC3KE78_EUCGR|nr:hypothetical protein EUGRSUZ_F00787 [Eucalyptus grandis]
MKGVNFIPILSIDGGGIRGIIAAVILSFLESELQKLDSPNVRIADYFHTIAGTSSGGLIMAMLTCPDKEGRPLFTTKNIIDFYLKESPKIFPQPRTHVWGLHHLKEAITCFQGPKYDGEYMHSVISKELGEKRLHNTLTNVVIVAYDTLLNDKAVFSSHEIKKSLGQDALLSDVCIATSAAPGYFPSHYFETIDPLGKISKFNLIDGAIAANNPILLEVTSGTNDLSEARKHGQFLLLSIGTGPQRKMVTMRVKPKSGAFPIGSTKEDDSLCGDLSSMDKATAKNLEDLVKFGKELLGKPVSKRNPNTGALDKETNAEALIRTFSRHADDKNY